MENLKIEYLSVDALKPYEGNARKHEELDVENIAKSIEAFGMNDPIGIWGPDNTIVEGHGRLLACKKLGIQEVPCIRLDHLTSKERREYAIAHNATAELSDWDRDILADELEDLDISDFDFEFGLDEEEDKNEVIEDEAPEIDEESKPTAKPGDIWQLGRHRLMCGNSTDPEMVAQLMDGEKADMVFTDPPYGMKKEEEGVANDNLNYDDLLEFNKKWIPLSFESLKDNGSWYCWGVDEPLMDIYSNILKPMAKENKITFRNLLTWDKGNGQGQLAEEFRMYPVADEKCLFVMCGKSTLHINSWKKKFDERFRPMLNYLKEQKKICGWDTPKMKTIAGCKGLVADHWTTTDQWRIPPYDVYEKFVSWAKEHDIHAWERSYESLIEEQNGIKKQYENERPYFNNTHDNMNDVWHFDRAGKEERAGHATPKPIALCARAMKSSSRAGERILDLFGGGGSTLMASEQLDRVCYMMELEPKWCDVIIQRWENFTGEKAVLLNGGD